MSKTNAERFRSLGPAVAQVLLGLSVCLAVSIGLDAGLLYVPALTAAGRNVVLSLALPVLLGLPLLVRSAALGRKVVALRNRLNRLATRDGATALLRPESFAALVERRALRRGMSGALLVVELENFQSIQIRFGFAWATSVEKAAADCVRASVRRGDIIGGFGPGRFAIFLPGASQDDARAVGERIIAEIEKAHWARPGGEGVPGARLAGVWLGHELPLEKTFAAALRELEQPAPKTPLSLFNLETPLPEPSQPTH